jgi:hypothetical protein
MVNNQRYGNVVKVRGHITDHRVRLTYRWSPMSKSQEYFKAKIVNIKQKTISTERKRIVANV